MEDRIKQLRDNIDSLIDFNDVVKSKSTNAFIADVTNGKFDVHLVEAFKKLEEASMAYGFALRSMKDHFDKTNV